MRIETRIANIFELLDIEIEQQDPMKPIETIYLNEEEYDYFTRCYAGHKAGFQYGDDAWQYTYRNIPVKKELDTGLF